MPNLQLRLNTRQSPTRGLSNLDLLQNRVPRVQVLLPLPYKEVSKRSIDAGFETFSFLFYSVFNFPIWNIMELFGMILTPFHHTFTTPATPFSFCYNAGFRVYMSIISTTP